MTVSRALLEVIVAIVLHMLLRTVFTRAAPVTPIPPCVAEWADPGLELFQRYLTEQTLTSDAGT